jgi:hypothetical protein
MVHSELPRSHARTKSNTTREGRACSNRASSASAAASAAAAAAAGGEPFPLALLDRVMRLSEGMIGRGAPEERGRGAWRTKAGRRESIAVRRRTLMHALASLEGLQRFRSLLRWAESGLR